MTFIIIVSTVDFILGFRDHLLTLDSVSRSSLILDENVPLHQWFELKVVSTIKKVKY